MLCHPRTLTAVLERVARHPSFKCILTIPAVLLLFSGCGKGHVLTLDEQIAEQEALAKKNGWSLLPSQIAAEVRIKPEENAALGVKAALRELTGPDYEDAAAEFISGYLPKNKILVHTIHEICDAGLSEGNPRLGELQKAIDQISPQLDKIGMALDKPKWEFDRKIGKSMAILYPDVSLQKDLFRAFMARAYLRARAGKAGVIDDLKTLRQYNAHLSSEPTEFPIIVAGSAELFASTSTRRILEANPSDKECIHKLEILWSQPPAKIDLRRLWRMDLTMALSSIDLLTSPAGLRELAATEFKPADLKFAKPARLKVLQIGNSTLEAWKGDPTDLEMAEHVLDGPAKELSEYLRGYHRMFDYLGIEINNTLTFLKQLVAIQRLTYIALKMIETNPYGPYTLPRESSEKPWLDPFCGKPFLLKKTDSGFVLYSVGANGIDNGGDKSIVDDRRLDVVWEFKTPKQTSRS